MVEAHATATDFLLKTYRTSRTFSTVKAFSFVADEDLRGRNVLLLTSPFCYVNCSDTPEKECILCSKNVYIAHCMKQ